MKILTMLLKQDKALVYDEDVALFEGVMQKDAQPSILLKNAYGHEISWLQQNKSGFKLFQSSKEATFQWERPDGTSGTLIRSKTEHTLHINSIRYDFYSGKLAEKEMLIGYEDQRFVFQCDMYENKIMLFLKDPSYGDIAVMFTLYFIAEQRPYSETSSFFSNLPEDMMSLL